MLNRAVRYDTIGPNLPRCAFAASRNTLQATNEPAPRMAALLIAAVVSMLTDKRVDMASEPSLQHVRRMGRVAIAGENQDPATRSPGDYARG